VYGGFEGVGPVVGGGSPAREVHAPVNGGFEGAAYAGGGVWRWIGAMVVVRREAWRVCVRYEHRRATLPVGKTESRELNKREKRRNPMK